MLINIIVQRKQNFLFVACNNQVSIFNLVLYQKV